MLHRSIQIHLTSEQNKNLIRSDHRRWGLPEQVTGSRRTASHPPSPRARLVGFTGKLLQIFKKWTVSVLCELFQSNFLEKQRRVQK